MIDWEQVWYDWMKPLVVICSIFMFVSLIIR